MEMAVCNAKTSLEKKRKRKQRRRGNTPRGDNRGCNPAEDNGSTENNFSQESPNDMCLNMDWDPEKGQSHSEINSLGEKNEEKHDDLQCGEATGISVLTLLNIKVLKEDDETSTSPNVDFCSVDGKENSSVPEDPDGKDTNMVKRDDEHTETVDHSTPSSHVESQRIRKRRRRRRKGRLLESPIKSLETNMEDEKKEETNDHLKNFVIEEVMNGVLSEESVDCSISEKTELFSANTKESYMVIVDPQKSKDFKNGTMVKKNDDCIETKYCLAQSNSDDMLDKTKRDRKKGRKRRKFADTFEESLNSDVEDIKKDAASNCLNEVGATSLHEDSTTTKIVKDVLVEEVLVDCSVGDVKEREETIERKVPHLLACDETNDNISATGLAKKKLLILDVNGLLVDFVPYFPDGYTPDFVISRKAGERKHI